MSEEVVGVNMTNFLVVFLMLIILQAVVAAGILIYEKWDK